MSAIFNNPDVNSFQYAKPINVFVVPVPEGTNAFFEPAALNIGSEDSTPTLRVDIYSPFELSDGEAEYMRAEVEYQVIAYAKQQADLSKGWKGLAILGGIDLLLLALLLIFVLINSDRSFLVFFWLFGVTLLPGSIEAVRVFSWRRRSRMARHLLHSPIVAALAGRSGDSTEAITQVWSDLGAPNGRRDLASLEESCRTAHWDVGVRFYRHLRQGNMTYTSCSTSVARRLMTIFIATSEPSPISHFPCRKS